MITDKGSQQSKNVANKGKVNTDFLANSKKKVN